MIAFNRALPNKYRQLFATPDSLNSSAYSRIIPKEMAEIALIIKSNIKTDVPTESILNPTGSLQTGRELPTKHQTVEINKDKKVIYSSWLPDRSHTGGEVGFTIGKTIIPQISDSYIEDMELERDIQERKRRFGFTSNESTQHDSSDIVYTVIEKMMEMCSDPDIIIDDNMDIVYTKIRNYLVQFMGMRTSVLNILDDINVRNGDILKVLSKVGELIRLSKERHEVASHQLRVFSGASSLDITKLGHMDLDKQSDTNFTNAQNTGDLSYIPNTPKEEYLSNESKRKQVLFKEIIESEDEMGKLKLVQKELLESLLVLKASKQNIVNEFLLSETSMLNFLKQHKKMVIYDEFAHVQWFLPITSLEGFVSKVMTDLFIPCQKYVERREQGMIAAVAGVTIALSSNNQTNVNQYKEWQNSRVGGLTKVKEVKNDPSRMKDNLLKDISNCELAYNHLNQRREQMYSEFENLVRDDTLNLTRVSSEADEFYSTASAMSENLLSKTKQKYIDGSTLLENRMILLGKLDKTTVPKLFEKSIKLGESIETKYKELYSLDLQKRKIYEKRVQLQDKLKLMNATMNNTAESKFIQKELAIRKALQEFNIFLKQLRVTTMDITNQDHDHLEYVRGDLLNTKRAVVKDSVVGDSVFVGNSLKPEIATVFGDRNHKVHSDFYNRPIKAIMPEVKF